VWREYSRAFNHSTHWPLRRGSLAGCLDRESQAEVSRGEGHGGPGPTLCEVTQRVAPEAFGHARSMPRKRVACPRPHARPFTKPGSSQTPALYNPPLFDEDALS